MKLNDREQNEPNRHYMGHLKLKSAFKHAQNVQIQIFFFFFFFCVEVLQPSQPNGVMSSAVSLPNRTFTGQA